MLAVNVVKQRLKQGDVALLCIYRFAGSVLLASLGSSISSQREHIAHRHLSQVLRGFSNSPTPKLKLSLNFIWFTIV
jgi:hypothetical protein